MTILIYGILILLVVNEILINLVPWDVRVYYAEKADIPIIGGILLYIAWKNIL